MSETESKPTPSNRKFHLLVAAFLLAAAVMGILSLKNSAWTSATPSGRAPLP